MNGMQIWTLCGLSIFGSSILHAGATEPPKSGSSIRIVTQAGESGTEMWGKRCRVCHSNPGMLSILGVKSPLEIRPWRVASQDAALFKQTVQSGRGKMPSFYLLTDAQLEDLRRYLVSVSTPASPLSPP